jgi:NAD(P)-dependent dehydrogenase (short-subunit alcohol dehydrogenase family)
MTSEQRIALITGGNRGIGRSAAMFLARDGVDSIITYHRHREEAEDVVAELVGRGRRAACLPLEVGDTTTFEKFAAALEETLREGWGRTTFDFLVNNAGVAANNAFADVTEADFDMLVDIHFKGPFFLTQRLAGLIADGGSVVNVSGTLARATFPARIAYGSIKGAVEVFTRYLAVELGPRGITANVVAPGAVATDFNNGVVRGSPDLQRRLAESAALGRCAVADDIGPVISSLLGDSHRWVTGQRIEASGGQHL